MHFHLPKPLHGWREFAGEVGIIVVGVLIALGAEQIVETVHWRDQASATRSALLQDASNNLGAALWRQKQQGCVNRRLDEIARVFEAHSRGQRLSLRGPVGHPVFYGGPQTGWQIALSSQAVAHMNLKEKLGFGDAFDNYANMTDVLKREQDAWLKLGLLDHQEILNETDWSALHQSEAEAASLSARMQIITTYVLANNTLGQSPMQLPDTPGVAAAFHRFCSPIL
jgi:hypothetical protein